MILKRKMPCKFKQIAKKIDEKRPVVGTIGATGFEGVLFPVAMETSCQPGESEFGGHEHTVQLLEKRDDTAQLSTVFEIDGTKTESCQQRKLLELSAVAEVQRNSSSLGKGQRRNLSSMTKVFSLISAAAQHLDSSCTDCWNRSVRDSPLVEAVEGASGEGLRTSFWNGHDLTTKRGRERLHQFCPAKRPRHVWFSSPCRVSGASSQRVSRVLHGIAAVVPRVQAQPLSASSRRQKSLMSMSEKIMKAVVNGCAWGLRDSQGSLLNRSWQVLTTSPDVQRVLNHRICDKKHKHGRLFDLSSESSQQFPKSLCQTLAKQFLVTDSWHSVLGILEHLHPDEDERPFNPSASSHETPKTATEHRCSACEESRRPALRHITSSYEKVPAAILEIDGMHWQHPVTGRHARCQFMVGVGFCAPMVTVFEETRDCSTRNNQASECKESLLKDWFVHRGRPSHSNGSRWLLHEQ